MEKTLYYAVSGTGQGLIFTSCPERSEHFKTWKGDMMGCFSMVVMLMESEGFALPPLKWSDEPVAIKLKLELSE